MFKQLLQKVSRQFHYLHLALLKPSTEVGSENRNQTNLKKEFPRFQKSKVCAHAGKDKTKTRQVAAEALLLFTRMREHKRAREGSPENKG